MNRRNFIFSAGVLVTASALPMYLYNSNTLDTENTNKRPDPNKFKEPVLKGIAYGINATNPHNTQAWKFKLLSENTLLFFIDETRLLNETDPTTRQIHIGCGCFLECMKLGMQRENYTSKITLFPEKEYTKKDIGIKPIAKIEFLKSTNVVKNAISNFIFRRKTSRLNYSDDKIDNLKFNSIINKLDLKFCDVQLINETNELTRILPILYKGMEIESYTYRTHEESRKWFRQNDKIIEEKRDGINFAGGGTTGITKWFAERELRNLDKEKWHDRKSNEIFLKKHKRKVLNTKGIVVFKTNTNSFIDWVRAGREYMRFSLACAEAGFYLHPLSQVLQEFNEMKIEREKFEQIMNVEANQKIQMAVRIGKSKVPYYSFRRFVKDLLV